MKKTLRAAAASGTGTATGILAGLVRVKLLAIFVGPAGLGVVSQITNLLQALSVGSNLGLGIAVTKTVAAARGRGDGEAVRRAAWTAFLTVTGTAAVASAALALAAPVVAARLLSNPALGAAVAVCAAGVLFTACGQIGTDVANGLRDVRTTSLSAIAGSVLSVSFVAALVPRYGLGGAIACLPLIAAGGAGAALAILIVRQRPALLPPPRPLFAPSVLRSLAKIGVASVALGLADQLVLLAVRTDLIRRFGVEANGLFQGTFGISQQIVTVAVAFHGAYSFPRVSEAASDEEANREIQEAFRVTLLLLGAAACALVLGRHFLIRGLLSRQFGVSAGYLPWQAAGHFARGAGLAVALGLLPRAGIRPWAMLGLTGAGAFGILHAALCPALGPAAPSVAWSLAGWIYLVLAYFLMRRATSFRLGRRNALVLVLAAPLFAVLARLSEHGLAGRAAGAALAAGWLLISIRPADVAAVRRLVRSRLGGDRE